MSDPTGKKERERGREREKWGSRKKKTKECESQKQASQKKTAVSWAVLLLFCMRTDEVEPILLIPCFIPSDHGSCSRCQFSPRGKESQSGTHTL